LQIRPLRDTGVSPGRRQSSAKHAGL
jgi:hypothetical protein